jgi:lysophospholipase L1-like esterase
MNHLLSPFCRIAAPAFVLCAGLTQSASAGTELIDFGFTTGNPTHGNPTVSPDSNGNYWNNVTSTGVATAIAGGTGLTLNNLVSTTNGASGINLTLAGPWNSSGIDFGGLNQATPALGSFGIQTATQDYYFTNTPATVTISGLNPAMTYDLSMFGSRNTTEVRISQYSVTDANGPHATTLQTSGPNIGGAGYNGNNSTIANLTALQPSATGTLTLTVQPTVSTYSYLGVLSITEAAPVTTNNQEVVVVGSSVAYGYGATDPSQGWANRLGTMLTTQAPLTPGSTVTWKFANASVSGNNTANVLSRYQNDVAVAHPNAKIVLIGLSLANEGLVGSTNPQPVYDSFKNGMNQIIADVRAQGAYPMYSLCYPQGTYNADQYTYVKRMNLLMNSWGMPSVNLLGALDDGNGHWAPGFTFDDGHPNSAGHAELLTAVVPTLFDAIVAGKTTSPNWQGATGYLTLQQDPAQTSPVRFTPSALIPMHSSTLSFRVRTTGNGTLAAVGGGANRATLEARSGGLVYVGPTGAEQNTGVNVNDGAWHNIALSHRYATSTSLVYVDGVLKGTVSDQLLADQFILGGAATGARAAAPLQADYQDLAIYRAAWTPEEAAAQDSGALQQASAEICAPLSDSAPAQGAALENRAQSMAQLTLNATSFTAHTATTDVPDNLVATSFSSGSASLSWQGHGGTGFVIERRHSAVSEAWVTVATVGAQTTIYEDSGLTATASYDYRISAVESATLRGDSSAIATIVPGGQAAETYQDWIANYYPEVTSTYLVDFGAPAGSDYGGVIWNTVTSPAVSSPMVLADTNNSKTAGVTVAITDSFDQTRADNGSVLPGYAAPAQINEFALRDDVPLTGAIKFAGLDPNSTYDFTFFARRGTLVAGFSYTGTYTFTGAGAPVVVHVDATLNTALTNVPPVTPAADGTVTLTLSTGTGTGTPFVVINFIQFTKSGSDPAYLAKIDPAGDPDGDGVSNFEEFARNLNPTQSDASPFTVKSFTKAAAGSNVRLQVVENRRASGVDYVLEKSADLTNWVEDTTATSSLTDRSGEFDTVAFDTTADGSFQFYRIHLVASGN